jgi:hypothetical protein
MRQDRAGTYWLDCGDFTDKAEFRNVKARPSQFLGRSGADDALSVPVTASHAARD